MWIAAWNFPLSAGPKPKVSWTAAAVAFPHTSGHLWQRARCLKLEVPENLKLNALCPKQLSCISELIYLQMFKKTLPVNNVSCDQGHKCKIADGFFQVIPLFVSRAHQLYNAQDYKSKRFTKSGCSCLRKGKKEKWIENLLLSQIQALN